MSGVGRRDFLKLGMLAAGAWCLSPGDVLGLDALAFTRDPLKRRGAPKRVTILGAGLAGLAAGYELTQAGHEVLIVEAQLRPGGRVQTHREPFAEGLYCEAGASRVPRTHALSEHWIRHFKLELEAFYPEGLTDVVYMRGRRFRVAHGETPVGLAEVLSLTAGERQLGVKALEDHYIGELLKQAVASLDDENWPPPALQDVDDISLADYLRQQGASEDAIRYLSWSFEDASVLDFVRDASSHAGRNYRRIKGGNDRLPRAFAAELASRIRYGSEVVRLEPGEQAAAVVVRHAGGGVQTIISDHVLCTLPFPVLRLIEVSPRFSARKRLAIDQLHYGSSTRISLQTSSRYWLKEGSSGYGETDHPMEVWSPTWSQPGTRGIMQGYTFQRMAQRLAAMSEKERIAYMVDALDNVYPGMRDHFEGGVSKCWDQDPWARGAFLVYMPGQLAQHAPHAPTPEGRVHFAGEHTSPWPAWMQGALYSGARAAREINNAE